MKSKEEQVLPIAELLPEGLSEAAVTEIATLVNSVIEEQVNDKVQQLEAKVKGFLRLRVDELKDHALRELQEQNETMRNAKLFESVKTLLALELHTEDEDSVISGLVKEQEDYQEEVEVLTEELRKSFNETDKMESLVKNLSKKVDTLEEEKTFLTEAVDALEAASEKPFKSSEKALVITENVDTAKSENVKELVDNDFLTPEVMKFMPSNPNPNSKI
jgi:outer membrane murein-binding lipoprotein Lpp